MASSEYDPFRTTSGLMFSRLSIEEQAAELASHYDLISFLALMQHCELDLLPIKWQPALESLGFGGTAKVNQALIHAQMSYAFKRVRDSGRGIVDEIRKWATEVLILCHPKLRSHPKIARLEACCLEVLKDGRLSPILVFEKAQRGDLEHFIALDTSRSIQFEEWVNLCLDIGSALETMHSCNAVHGDIKPSNILVFHDLEGRHSAKLTDFGYASMSPNEDSLVQLPNSRLWTAPDHHPRSFEVKVAKKMDVYSYGLVCFWLLIGKISIRACEPNGDIWKDVKLLESMKNAGSLYCFAEDALMHSSTISIERKQEVLDFFALVLAEKHEDRSRDWNLLLPMLREQLLIAEDSSTCSYASVETAAGSVPNITRENEEQQTVSHPQFSVREYINSLGFADPRVRTGITAQLEVTFREGHCEPCKRNAAFQLAFCSYIVLGNSSSKHGNYQLWLERSGFSGEDLERELERVRNSSHATYKQNAINNIMDEFLFAVDLAHEYRHLQPTEFSAFRLALLEEAQGCESAFGGANSITVSLKRALATFLNARCRFNEALLIQKDLIKALENEPVGIKVMMDLSLTYSLQGFLKEAESIRSEVVDRLKEALGPQHAGTLSAMSNLASVRNDLGRHEESEVLLLEVIDAQRKKFGPEHHSTLNTMSFLAAVYFDQRRYADAEELQSQIVRSREINLGHDHAFTWTSQLNLAAIITMQGRLEEGEIIELKVIELRKKYLEPNHHLTLTALSNLGATYRKQKRWRDEEFVLQQVVIGRLDVLGSQHRDTLVAIQALANNFISQNLPDKAEPLLQKMVDVRSSLQGPSDPSTLASRTSLAWARFDRGLREEAEEMQLGTIEMGRQVHGETHEAVVHCTRHLAMMYKCGGQLDESRRLHIMVWETRKRELGLDHPDTKKSAKQVQQVEAMIEKGNKG